MTLPHNSRGKKMKFELIKGSKIGNTVEQYFINERSFDCNPSANVDINVAIAYLNLGIDGVYGMGCS